MVFAEEEEAFLCSTSTSDFASFDGASPDGEGEARGEGERRTDSASAKTIGDVFASMMNQNRMAAGVRPVPAAALGGSPIGQSNNLKSNNVVATVGRNDPCPCGSGKKYKKCCGKGLV